MKKIIIIPIAVLTVLVFGVYFVAFTPAGSNAVIKPIVNSKLKKSNIEVKKLDSKYKYINIDALLQKSVNLNAKGSVGYFDKSFKLDYNAQANQIELNKQLFPLNLNIVGKAVGDADNFALNGKGKAFESDIEYKVIVKNSKPYAIKAAVASAKLSQIFSLANIAPVVDGLAFLNIYMPSLDIKNPSGRAKLIVKDALFNNKLIAKNYKIALPKDEKFKAKLIANVANKKVVASGDINATSIKLTINKLISTLDFKTTKAYFNANIANLQRLQPIIKKPLRGSLKLNGVLYSNLNKNITQASIKTKSLGGLAKVFYANNKININLNNVSIPKIEHMARLPKYVSSGLIGGTVKIPNLKKLNGVFDITSSGVLSKKLFKMQIPSYKYSLRSNGNIKNGKVKLNKSYLKTSFAKLFLTNTNYSLLTTALTTDFKLIVNNLSLLNNAAKTNLNGSATINGKASYLKGKYDYTAFTKSLGGEFKAAGNQDKLKANFKNISVSKLLSVVNQPKLLNKGFATGSVNLYSIKKLNGVASLATNGSVNCAALQKLYNINLGKSFKYTLKSQNIIIKKGIVKANNTMLNSTLGKVNFTNTLYIIKSGNFRSKYNVDIPNLAKLEPIAKQKLNGSLQASGSIEKDGKNILITGVANKFGGNINFRYKNGYLVAKGAGLNIVKVLQMLNKPEVLDGVALVNLNYNTSTKQGKFNATISQAKFLNSKLVQNLKQYAHFDLTKEAFNDVKIDGIINGDIVTFNLNAQGSRVKIKINGGKINIKEQTIKTKISVTYHGNEYNFKVYGPLSDPSYKLSFSGAVKEKVLQKAKDKLKDTSIGKKIDKLIPGILKGSKKSQETNATTPPPQENLEKKAKDKIKNKAKELLKGLF